MIDFKKTFINLGVSSVPHGPSMLMILLKVPDGRTDRRTDRPSYRDARTHLKMTKLQKKKGRIADPRGLVHHLLEFSFEFFFPLLFSFFLRLFFFLSFFSFLFLLILFFSFYFFIFPNFRFFSLSSPFYRSFPPFFFHFISFP